jgi:hypothetical protein
LLFGLRAPGFALFEINEAATDQAKHNQRGDEPPANSALHEWKMRGARLTGAQGSS